MTQENQFHRSNDSCGNSCIVSKDLVLKDEHQLPKAFSKVLLRLFLENPEVWQMNSDEFVNEYMYRLDNISYIFIMIHLSDKALAGAALPQEASVSEYDVIRDRIFYFYLSAIRSRYLCFPAVIDGVRMFIIKLGGDAADGDIPYQKRLSELEESLLEMQQEMRQEMLEKFGFIPQLLASDIGHDLGDMPALFQRNYFSIEHLFASLPDRSVITFLLNFQIIPDTSDVQPKPEFERLYFDCIANYDFNMANTILQQRITEETRSPSPSISVRNRIQPRMAWTLSFLGLPANRSLLDCIAIYDCVEYVVSCKTIDEMRSCVEDFFHKLGVYYRKSSMVIGEKIDMISDYIKENYKDHNLSVGRVCEVFNVSPAHLSRVFKKKTGLKMIDYIHVTRLAQARDLIQDNSKNIDEIAREVGYAGDWTLTRAFKRYEGVTPGSLRSK